MNADAVAKPVFRTFLCALALSFPLGQALGAATSLSDEPMGSSSSVTAKPNILFVLDDSGSMRQDYLPDWAGPYQQIVDGVLTTITPAHRFFNRSYNGVAYNPNTYYQVPVMYDGTGARDTTTYPSMDGRSAATGGDASASAEVPNWRAVRVDGYGIQSAATADIEGRAYSYTTIAGEYCDSKQLRNCVVATAPSGTYTQPAQLRWCSTSAAAVATTVDAGTLCQAGNIDDNEANILAGVTPYIYPRMARPRTATVSVNAALAVTNIAVDGQEILFTTASGGTSTDVATAIAAQINACTYVRSGNCATVGFSAVTLANVVTITAPTMTTSSPVITGGTTSVLPFDGGNVPGGSLFTVISPSVTTYPFPGSAAKGANRIDCAGATCTYAEEMTNYANWYAYYRTRMQMMKTSASLAFATVDDNFRVGYFSINNGSGSDFINLSDFNGTQKNLWYSKFFQATPYGTTPLRAGLATAGRIYAGKINLFNGVTVADPMQYSCQQNYTILSTDGYWNDVDPPTKIDGSTAVDNQDGGDPRPFYDGATQTRTVSKTMRTDEQIGINSFLVESRTQVQQVSTKRLTETVVTTELYPWTSQTTRLQYNETPLQKSAYKLEQRSFPLTSVTKQLQESIYKLNSTPRNVRSVHHKLKATTIGLQKNVFNITSVTTPLQEKTFNITSVTTPLQKKTFNITSVTTRLQKKTFNITSVTTPLQKKTFNITSVTTGLQRNTYKLQSSTRQLQKRMEVSSDGGDTWYSDGWLDVASCSERANGPGQTRNTTCRYDTAVVAGGLDSCTSLPASPGPIDYSVASAVTCAYETTPVVAGVTSCNTVAQPNLISGSYQPSVSCTYTGSSTTLANATSCSAIAQSTGPSYTGPARTCTFNELPASTSTETTCDAATPANASAPKVTCTYTAPPTTVTNATSCTAVAQSVGPSYVTARTCTFNASPASTSTATTCNAATPANASAPKVTCTYTGAVTTATNATSCTAVAQSTGNPYQGPARTCAFNALAATTANTTSCTAVTPLDFSAPKVSCSYTGAAVTLPNETSCSTVAPSAGPVYSGPQRSCTFNATAASTVDTTMCTAVTPPDASAPKVTCAYSGTPVTLPNATSCTKVDESSGSDFFGPARTCTFNSVAASVTNVTTCTESTPANASAPKTTCTYTGAPSVVDNQSSCTTIEPGGPSITICAYEGEVIEDNVASCTSGSASPGPNLVEYDTCVYMNGTTTSGLDSCTYVPDSPGPIYTPANACAYSTTPAVANVPTCTPVAQAVDFSAPQKTCAYEVIGTPATNLVDCTNVAQSSSAPFSGPNVSCGYSGTATVTNLDASSCTVHDSGASPYSGGAKIACSYNPTPSITVATTCNQVPQTVATADGTVYSPAVSCAYGPSTGWSNATAACVAVPESAGPSYVGPARQCQYTAPSVDTYTANCTPIAQNNVNLNAVACLAGSFPQTLSTNETIVDVCATGSTTDSAVPVETTTATTCAYNAATLAPSNGSCTPHAEDANSPYTTAVGCTTSDTGFVGTTACTLVGTSPNGFDATGVIVECRKTDLIGTTSNTPPDFTTFTTVSPVPVGSCTPGTVDNVQTRCMTMLQTGPAPVAASTCVDTAPLAPDFVKTTCVTTTESTTVMGCSAPAPSAPLWQTVSCGDFIDGTKNTLADAAAYYYKTDLRTPDLGNCTGAIVAPALIGNALCSATEPMNNVPGSASDPATWQHMTTFTLGLGASGYMRYSDTYLTDTSGDFPTVKGVSPYNPENGIAADPATGVCSWQTTGNCNWPHPDSDQQTGIDDLWHAAVNGRGVFYSAGDPAALSAGITSALDGVASAQGTASAPGISTPNLTSMDNYIFSSSYVSLEWTGDLVRYRVDPYTGIVASQSDWAAQSKLDAKSAASRSIYTFDNGADNKLKAFTSANYGTHAAFNTPNVNGAVTGLTQFLCASPEVCLSSADQTLAAGGKLVDYLRGDRTHEGIDTNNSAYYRQRLHILGDMVNSQTVYVNQPTGTFVDPGYSDFKTAVSARQAVVYVGANDGMLHAFAAKGSATTEALVDAYASAYAAYRYNSTASLLTAANAAGAAATAALAADTSIGQELWAYIPTMALPNLYKLADKKYRNMHRYFVDGTPVVSDVCTSGCSDEATATWKTILVGGLGHGGRGYFALDITDPAAPKALWEFTDANLGYSYGNPQIAKLANGTWVVMFSSGYNNIPAEGGGDGVGRLYVLNAGTGVQVADLSPISTGAGSVASPSGLAEISAMVVDPQRNRTISAVYGGDLLGKLWRFDVNDSIGQAGYEAQLLAALKDGAGNAQPITTKPAVTVIKNQKVIYVGTGRFLHSVDIGDQSQQSLYAIKDPGTAAATPATPLFDNPGGDRTADAVTGINANNFVVQTQSWIDCPADTSPGLCDATMQVMTSTRHPVDFQVNDGWVVDLINPSERANTNPALALGLLVFTTNAPSSLACDIGGKSYLYFLDYMTGGPVLGPENPNGVIGYLFANAFASAPTIVGTLSASGNIGRPRVIIQTAPGAYQGPGGRCEGDDCEEICPNGICSPPVPPPPPQTLTQRTAWRELIVGQ